MKKPVSKAMKVDLTKNLLNHTIFFVGLHGNSYSALGTRKDARKFIKYLRDTAKWMEHKLKIDKEAYLWSTE